MKTAFAIALTLVLAAATLTFGAPVTPISGTAVAGPPDQKCGFAPGKQAPYGVPHCR
jgi:hypothetical protein